MGRDLDDVQILKWYIFILVFIYLVKVDFSYKNDYTNCKFQHHASLLHLEDHKAPGLKESDYQMAM